LGLDGFGNADLFADYSQWETWQRSQETRATEAVPARNPAATPRGSSAKRKLSYIEAREYATIEERIAEAEQSLESNGAELNHPAIASDGPRLLAISAEVEQAQRLVDLLYARWAELDEKLG